jgi:hypothetical protein
MRVAGPERPEQAAAMGSLSGVVGSYSARIDSRWRSPKISLRLVTSVRAVSANRSAQGFARGLQARSSRLEARAGTPSQISSQVSVLVAGFHGRCPCPSVTAGPRPL